MQQLLAVHEGEHAQCCHIECLAVLLLPKLPCCMMPHTTSAQHSSSRRTGGKFLDLAHVRGHMTLQVRAAAEAALETLSVCEACSQVGLHQTPARTATPAHCLPVCRSLASTASA